MVHHKAVVLLAACSIPLLAGCADTLSIQTRSFRVHIEDPVRRVAVVDFAGEGGQGIADMLTMHLQRAGFDVVERQYLSDLLQNAVNPIREGHTDATLTERIAKIGKLLNADAVITGDLVNLARPRYQRKSETRLVYAGAVCHLSARAFDVRTREVFWTTVINVTATAKNGDHLGILDYIDEACAELVESFARSDYADGTHIYRGAKITALRKKRVAARGR